MRKYALLLVATAAVLALASGVALAAEAIIGTDGPDTIRGTNGDDSVLAKGGNDGDGRNRLDCGPGVDNFIADPGDRVLANCEINGV